MAQASTNDNISSSEDDRQIQLPERDLTELLLRLISSVGETEKLRNERDQLQYQLYQTGNGRIYLDSEREDCSRIGKRTLQDVQTNMSTLSTDPVDRQQLTAQQQTQIPRSEGVKTIGDIDFQADKCRITNSTDSGMGSGSDICTNVSRPRQREQQSTAMPDCCFPGSLAGEMSENIDVRHVSSNRKSKQLKKSSDEDIRFECDGASGSSLLSHEEEDIFGNQMQYIGSPQVLQRATSSKQDDQTSCKRKNEMKKTGSHESYFPVEGKNNKDLPFYQPVKPLYWQRKSSYSAMSSGNTTKALEKAESLMISCFPQIASKNVFNGISCELVRVRKDYMRLEQQREEMREEISQLKRMLEETEAKLKEREGASEDVRKIQDDHMVELNKVLTELENEKKLHASLEKILTDERARFERDEKHLQKKIEKLKRQLQSETEGISANQCVLCTSDDITI